MVICQKEFTNMYWRHNYPQYWNRIIEKNHLKPVNNHEFTNLQSYRFIGMIGDKIYKDITTGPCLLTPKEIRSLNKNTTIDDIQEMLMRHPTFEDYTAIAVETKEEYSTNIIIETYEYAKLIEYKTEISFEEALKLTKKAGENFKKYYNKKLKNNNKNNPNNDKSGKLKYFPTHKSSFDSRLRELCNEYYIFYLNNSNISKKGRAIIESNPEESTWLRIKVSFLPEAINKNKTTIIEPASSIDGMKYANMISGSSSIITRSPPTITNKPVMNGGYDYEILYLNGSIEEEFKKFRLNEGKTPYGCPAYNLYAFLCNNHDENTDEFREYNKNCKKCMEYLKDKLKNIIVEK
ncbi:hypothetical protein [Methanothermococcus okinawensis]|uniref:Uncharacterized protein n=1 Tax=Methanothermococcus okinawensis (strain DSM 14208 / JCM 11175 / IH1) TaxID=647113 RepID=F8ALU8_METOI|nr:hypothetical protein [Methanothermococcus okinawensis]AEH07435.1 hypothetical protein Metok_1472 [Methanothermococcus okinawensis IH1]